MIHIRYRIIPLMALVGGLFATTTWAAPPAWIDTDGDGVVSADEREAAKQARDQRREERQAKFLSEADTDGDGVVSEAERQAAREAHRAKMEQRRAQNGGRFQRPQRPSPGRGDGFPPRRPRP